MSERAWLWVAQLDEKRVIAIGVAGALVALSLDSAVAHFAGRTGAHPAQWLPVTLGPAASAMILIFAIPKLPEARFRRAMMVIGGIVATLGAIGTAFHLQSLLVLLSVEAFENALAEGPPLFAPGGFLGLGTLLVALGSTKLVVRFGLGAGVNLAVRRAASHAQDVPHLADLDLGAGLVFHAPFAATRRRALPGRSRPLASLPLGTALAHAPEVARQADGHGQDADTHDQRVD